MAVASSFSFYTIQGVSEGVYKEKGSKFLAFCYSVQDEDEVKTRLDALRKQYFDASHHCYAWMIGADKKRFRAFDDGEPSHSAGTPILGQIKSKNLTNVLIVVVRYFGGTKLGVGGLTQAYKAAAEIALGNAAVVEVELTASFTLDFEYSDSAEVMRMVKEFDLAIVHQAYDERAQLVIDVKLRNKENFLEKIKLLKALGTKLSAQENAK
jgi:uncharacterized YigZ family protein